MERSFICESEFIIVADGKGISVLEILASPSTSDENQNINMSASILLAIKSGESKPPRKLLFFRESFFKT